MKDNKLTPEEIIKALECCADLFDCTNCPCKEFCGDLGKLQQNALDLINRQQEEIERLTINTNAFGLGMKQEKERADTIRAEAIKEFAERLKEKVPLKPNYHDFVKELIKIIHTNIDNLAKEMAGEDK
jgi:RNase H-fold protein (predicted Holliday junction resolvase)